MSAIRICIVGYAYIDMVQKKKYISYMLLKLSGVGGSVFSCFSWGVRVSQNSLPPSQVQLSLFPPRVCVTFHRFHMAFTGGLRFSPPRRLNRISDHGFSGGLEMVSQQCHRGCKVQPSAVRGCCGDRIAKPKYLTFNLAVVPGGSLSGTT